ncbi:hypothetical protein EZJ19_08050 [Parasulfuritortus cantonensis]|uniref:Uncharacterized protein n=1 Tax=Parasulfuritortus cantonensis TaxID=2528202 RepID=A0A4R1BDD2_9PROT|nr:hypothetical protein [Parasulfuritortus cantonensis]TCJ15106.1 hypothetical protein EZJ19_08050 [Parasulfuritortus cantonensis]
MAKATLSKHLFAALLLGGTAALAWAEAAPGDAAARHAPWGDGPPPWVKDGQVDEAAKAAYFARRAQADQAATPSAGAAAGRPDADASPEAKRAYWQKRAAERAASAPAGDPGQADHAGHAGHTGMAPAPAPAAPAPRWGGGRDALLWLTDSPPRRGGHAGGRPGGGRPGMTGMAGMAGMAEGGPDAMASKRVWLRAGANPLDAHPASGDETALLQGPDGKAAELPVEAHGGPYNVTFPTPEQGYYNVYLIRRILDQDALEVTAAKAEVTRAGMGHGLSREDNARLVPARTDARVPVEIVRERKDKEALFTRVSYGDAISFQVLRNGKPVQNARVTFTSGQGWSHSVQSDEDGRASFTVIRDYYPDEWRLFDKRHRETWLVAASFTTPEAGDYQGGRYARTRYTATLSGAYYPGVTDYESYSDGLLVGLAGLLFTGTGIYAYRRRRVQPYKEVRFDD